MSEDALFLQASDIAERSAVFVFFPIGSLVHTMDKRIVDIICFQLSKLPIHGTFYCLRVRRPAVTALRIIGAEMQLIHDVFAHSFKGLSENGKTRGVARGEVVIVDSVLVGQIQCFDKLLFFRLGNSARTEADDAYFISRTAIGSVFHFPSPCGVPHALFLSVESVIIRLTDAFQPLVFRILARNLDGKM